MSHRHQHDIEESILIVDDDIESLQFLTQTLEEAGYDVFIAHNGEDALTKLASSIHPSIILMDAVMPGVDGFETTRQIKQATEISAIPVIFMTGLQESEHVVNALEAGGVDYVRKPIEIEELLARLRVHLNNARRELSSRSALDDVGRPVVLLGLDNQVVWATPSAEKVIRMLDEDWQSAHEELPSQIHDFLNGHQFSLGARHRIAVPDGEVEIAAVRRTERKELLVQLRYLETNAEPRKLAESFELTQREAEVLYWLSFGKPNRVISEILGISPRTINKHLEHIFEKLGVETRSAAAACAVRVLAD